MIWWKKREKVSMNVCECGSEREKQKREKKEINNPIAIIITIINTIMTNITPTGMGRSVMNFAM